MDGKAARPTECQVVLYPKRLVTSSGAVCLRRFVSGPVFTRYSRLATRHSLLANEALGRNARLQRARHPARGGGEGSLRPHRDRADLRGRRLARWLARYSCRVAET